MGRHVVGNLTTVSTSVRDFTTLLVGYWLAEQVAEKAGTETELGTFLKWEQLVAHARWQVNKDGGFRGTERVQAASSRSSRVQLGWHHQILSNQKIYGLWGLYTVPAHSSGMIHGSPSRLTPPAREFVERTYISQFTRCGLRDARAVVDMLVTESVDFDFRGRELHQKIGEVVGQLMNPQLLREEKEFYRRHLLHGGPQDRTDGRQSQLAEILEAHHDSGEFSWQPGAVMSFAKTAARRGPNWRPLASRLERIAVAESVLAPAAALFGYLLSCHGVTPEDIAQRLANAWGARGLAMIDTKAFAELESELADGVAEVGRRWTYIAEGLCRGDYGAVLRLLVEQNRYIMKVRGNAGAWIEITGGKLDVRVKDESGWLPNCDKLPSLWRHSYFLNALFIVGATLGDRVP